MQSTLSILSYFDSDFSIRMSRLNRLACGSETSNKSYGPLQLGRALRTCAAAISNSNAHPCAKSLRASRRVFVYRETTVALAALVRVLPHAPRLSATVHSLSLVELH